MFLEIKMYIFVPSQASISFYAFLYSKKELYIHYDTMQTFQINILH